MAIFISNSMYLAAVALGEKNLPLIGWESLFTPSGAYSDQTAAGYLAAAVWSGDTYTRWRSVGGGGAGVTAELILQLSLAQTVNYAGFVGHNFGSRGISYQIFGLVSGMAVDLTPVRTPTDDRPVIEYFNPVSATFIAIRMFIPAGAEGATIAHAKAGKMLQLQRSVWGGETPGGMDKRVEKIKSVSYSGQYLGSVLVSKGASFSITQKNNTVAFVRSAAFQNFLNHAVFLKKMSDGPVESFFYVWRPDTHPTEVQYCGEVKKFDPPTNATGTLSGGLMQWAMAGDAFE